MMRRRLSKRSRILTAAVFSALIIVGSYMLARGIEFPSLAHASDTNALLQTLATKDSDHDGLPDWEEALYGTDPHNPDTFNLGMTDGEAVARGLIVPKSNLGGSVATTTATTTDSLAAFEPQQGTLTAAFAQSFLSLYASAKQANNGGDLSASDLNTIATQAVDTLTNSVKASDTFKTMSDLTVVGSGKDALMDFAGRAGTIMLKNTTSATSSATAYLKLVAENGDAGATAQLESLSNAYQAVATGLAALPVPEEMEQTDLLLVNATARLGQIIHDFSKANTDPLTVMFALKEYPDALVALRQAFTDTYKVYDTAKVPLITGTPGYEFVHVLASVPTTP